MNVEPSLAGSPPGELERRVRVLAALADRGRLQVVDVLGLTDASPTELERALGMASNLLAHHLGVLERAGLVSRHRSEADRRRSYVQLVPGALEGLLPAAVQPVKRVVFVCTANSARSKLAAALWAQASDVPSTSAGTHPAETIAPGALQAAARHSLDLPEARPRHLADVVTDYDLVVTVCDHAHEELAALPDPTAGAHPGRADAARVRRPHWSVADPVSTGDPAAFDTAYDDLARRVSQLAPRLAAS
jgi:ArsR family transcriptional regulator, arsenate/arsenite/antimonite-responsive transcriptional repressor / arsenate reductase (thioredoxin)